MVAFTNNFSISTLSGSEITSTCPFSTLKCNLSDPSDLNSQKTTRYFLFTSLTIWTCIFLLVPCGIAPDIFFFFCKKQMQNRNLVFESSSCSLCPTCRLLQPMDSFLDFCSSHTQRTFFGVWKEQEKSQRTFLLFLAFIASLSSFNVMLLKNGILGFFPIHSLCVTFLGGRGSKKGQSREPKGNF